MRKTIIQCEGCEKQYRIPHSMGEDEWARLRSGWLTLHAECGERHYCSETCLIGSLGGTLLLPTSKMRRFLLADGDTADEQEGIVWGDGRVSIAGYHIDTFESWKVLRHDNAGCGVTWIDQ